MLEGFFAARGKKHVNVILYDTNVGFTYVIPGPVKMDENGVPKSKIGTGVIH
jgi:hypothetical protein